MRVDELLSLDFGWPKPRNKDAGIGVVGAGLIVNNAHLPAYMAGGYRVAAIYDPREDAARRTAERFGVPVVCRTLDELLARSDVKFVDIATPPEPQFEIARAAIAAGKHLLCQKPLSESLESATTLVELAEKAGTLLAVNQQMRWTASVRYVKLLADRGCYGEVTEARFEMDDGLAWDGWAWAGQKPRAEYFLNSIHYIDIMRFLLGEPKRIIASSAQFPGQKVVAETRTTTILEYSDTLQATILSNHNNWTGKPRMLLTVSGTDGRSESALAVKDYPQAARDGFSFAHRTLAPGWSFTRQFDELWLPTAFERPMADLMVAAEAGSTPLTAGRDNLGTLRVVHAAYRSIDEGRAVALSEFEA